jgi:hypothetical protein
MEKRRVFTKEIYLIDDITEYYKNQKNNDINKFNLKYEQE